MATLLKNNLIFLHLPKTGGTSLRFFFKSSRLIVCDFASDHADMQRVLNVSKHYPGNFWKRSIKLGKSIERVAREGYKFCFVRHPLNWYVSWWRFMEDHNWESFAPSTSRSRLGFYRDPWHPTRPLEKCKDHDFNGFIEKVIEMAPGYLHKLYDQYAPEKEIDYIGKLETFEEDIHQIFSIANIDHNSYDLEKIGQVNASKTSRPTWDEMLADKMRELEKPAFERFGYQH